MATRYYDDNLLSHTLPSFSGGYNSYAGGKSTVADNEFPYGQNVVVEGNGSTTKRNGSSRYTPQISNGHKITGLGWLSNSTYNELIISSNTSWYNKAATPLSGMSFTADKETHFCQAIDRLYGANNTNNLAYTSDGLTITEVSTNGNIGDWPVYYNQRLYMTNAANPDRIYYSNPINATASSYSAGDFGTFDTNLSATPKKNAGFIILIPGGGVVITRLYLDNTSGTDYLYAYTKRHGIWRISYSAVNNDGSIAHTITQVVSSGGTPSGKSLVKVANDQWYYGGDNWYSYGEQAQYQNLRISTKGGRVKREADTISSGGKNNVAGAIFKNKIYSAYQTGSYNDRLEIYDVRLNSWSSPIVGINANCFLVYEDDSGISRLLAGSSNPNDSYVYELETGTDDVSNPVDAFFETKSTDCGKPGLFKYFGFIDVSYSLVYGVLTYEVFVDEVLSITGSLQLGNSNSMPVGVGSTLIGSTLVGSDYDPNTTFASLAQNDTFRIDCGYTAGKKVSVRFSNNNTGEQFKIDSLTIWYIPGSIYQT